ncbi:hypothetical protein C8Q75DRAFT_271436 [Abortiporus biennis]|nr:hypothetical protein C8Q75DRAFT_271436 [Abortiporus biennis]
MIAQLLHMYRDTRDYIRALAVTTTPDEDTIEEINTMKYNVFILSHDIGDKAKMIPHPSIFIWYNLSEDGDVPVIWSVPSLGGQTYLVYIVPNDDEKQQELLKHNLLSNKFDSQDLKAQSIEDPTTGRVLTFVDAIRAFHQTLKESGITDLHKVVHICKVASNKYIGILDLPSSYPILLVCGFGTSTLEAEQAVCFQACCSLFQTALLPLNAFLTDPVAMTQSVSVKDTNTLNIRSYVKKRSEFWYRSLSTPPGRLYPTIVSIQPFGENIHPPMLILTRLPLPYLADFSLYNSGSRGTVHLQPAAPFPVIGHQFQALLGYTVRISRSLLNKPFTCTLDEIAYFFAPLTTGWSLPSESDKRWRAPSVQEHIAWEDVKFAAEQYMVPVVSEGAALDDTLKDAIIQDRWVEFTNRNYVKRIRYDLTPMSKPEDGSRQAGYETFVDHLKANRKTFTELKDYKQPMIEVASVPCILNYLTPSCRPHASRPNLPVNNLVPELCAKFTIPASTYRTIQFLPSIAVKIDLMLVAKEFNSHFFDNEVAEEHLIPALTTPSAVLDCNYERLEFLGDTFLKYVASIYVYITMPNKQESALHHARLQIINNKALLRAAILAGLPPYIHAKPFVAKVWQPSIPPRIDVSSNDIPGEDPRPSGQGRRRRRERQHEDRDIQCLGDKTVADIVEAIIGAALLSGGPDLAFKAMKTLEVAIPEVQNWSDFARKSLHTLTAASQPISPAIVRKIENIVGHKIQEPVVLGYALTHASSKGYNIITYERLEFIGDAILDFLVVKYIYDRHPTLTPGALTLLKTAMVTNPTLAVVSVTSGLYQCIQYNGSDIKQSIDDFVLKVQHARDEELKAVSQENREPGQYWTELDPPKILSDVVESLFGALLISDNFTTVGIEKFFDGVLKPFYDRHIRLQTLSLHPNKTLFELFHASGCQQHSMEKTMDSKRTQFRYDVVVHDIILASATDESTVIALRRAASYALDALEGDPDFMMRECDCRSKTTGGKTKPQELSQLGYTEEENTMVV